MGLRFSEKDIGRHCRVRSSTPVSLKTGGKTTATRKPSSGVKESIWQRKLFDLLVANGMFPVWEMKGAIPGRRFRIDIAFPEAMLAIEIDGWQHHGKTLDAFKIDRKRQNLLVVHGWRVLRFFPGEISKTPDECVSMIRMVLERKNDSQI